MAFTSKTTFVTNIATGTSVDDSEKQGARGHATIHNNIGSVLNNLQDKVGIDSSTDSSSLDYKISNASSTNPGHLHTLSTGATDVTASAAELNTLDGINGDVVDTGSTQTVTGIKTFDTLTITEGTTTANAINFGSDTALFRSAASTLKTEDGFQAFSLTSNNDHINIYTDAKQLRFGDSAGGYDTNLYRSAANTLKTDDDFVMGASATVQVNLTSITGFIQGGFALKVYDATNNGTGLMLGDAAGGFDTILYRSAANTFKTEDNFIIEGTTTLATSLTGILRADSGVVSVDTSGSAGFSHWLNHTNAEFPDSNFPSIGKTVGTNFVYTTLDFDSGTDETCYWYVAIPADVTPATANLVIYWTASAGTAAQAVYWACTVRSIADDQVIDATTTPNTSANTANDALIATGDIHKVSMSLTLTDWAAGELLLLKFSRDADNGSDTLAADAKIVGISLEVAE